MRIVIEAVLFMTVITTIVLTTLYVTFTYKGRNIMRTKILNEYQCVDRIDRGQMQFGHLTGYLEHQERYETMVGYYKCNPIRRFHVVAIEMSKSFGPVARLVRGLPGDTFQVEPDKENHGWRVILNGKPLMSGPVPYFFGSLSSSPILRQQASAFNGIIPVDHYLIFTTIPRGEADSSAFGLIPKQNIIGRVLREPTYLISF